MKLNDFGPFFSKERHNVELEKMYINYKGEFIAYVQKNFFVDIKDIEDIYQESFLALWKDINSGKLTPENLKASIKTYLFKIGLNKLYNFFRDRNNRAPILEKIKDKITTVTVENPFFDEETGRMIRKEAMDLGERCNSILMLSWFEHKNLKEIALLTGYKSEQTAKIKRLSCMEQLKKNIKQKYTKEDFFYE